MPRFLGFGTSRSRDSAIASASESREKHIDSLVDSDSDADFKEGGYGW